MLNQLSFTSHPSLKSIDSEHLIETNFILLKLPFEFFLVLLFLIIPFHFFSDTVPSWVSSFQINTKCVGYSKIICITVFFIISSWIDGKKRLLKIKRVGISRFIFILREMKTNLLISSFTLIRSGCSRTFGRVRFIAKETILFLSNWSKIGKANYQTQPCHTLSLCYADKVAFSLSSSLSFIKKRMSEPFCFALLHHHRYFSVPKRKKRTSPSQWQYYKASSNWRSISWFNQITV